MIMAVTGMESTGMETIFMEKKRISIIIQTLTGILTVMGKSMIIIMVMCILEKMSIIMNKTDLLGMNMSMTMKNAKILRSRV
jgi:hypothetical protein